MMVTGQGIERGVSLVATLGDRACVWSTVYLCNCQ